MKSILRLCCCLLCLATWLPTMLQAAVPTRGGISSYIESSRRSKGVLLNAPKYDKKAKVFYLCYLGYNVKDRLESAVSPLVPVCDEISQSGAELVLYLDFPPGQKDDGKKKPRGKRGAAGGAQVINCPIVNIFESKTRDALFKKDAQGKEYSYGTYELRAVDANGTPLAYFRLDKGSIAMRDARTGEKKVLGTESYSGSEWMGPAILASYKELVDQLTAPTDTRSDADKPKPEKKKSGKKRGKRD